MRDHMINGKIRASMKDKCYAVSLKVNGDGNILSGSCECSRGHWICSHMAATAVYANKRSLSKTDLPHSWIARPKKAAKTRRKKYESSFLVAARPRLFLHKKLKDTAVLCPMKWLLEPEPKGLLKQSVEPVLIEDVLQELFGIRI